MEQSTKLFISLALLFVLYATMRGHLKSYLALLWGNSTASTNQPAIVSTVASQFQGMGLDANSAQAATDMFNMAFKGFNTLGVNVGQK